MSRCRLVAAMLGWSVVVELVESDDLRAGHPPWSVTVRRYVETNAERLRRYRLAAVDDGLCYTCRLREPDPGRRNCRHCVIEGNDRRRTGPARELARAGRRRYLSKVETQRRADGLCIGCGKVAPEPDRVRCRSCLDAEAERQRDYQRRVRDARRPA